MSIEQYPEIGVTIVLLYSIVTQPRDNTSAMAIVLRPINVRVIMLIPQTKLWKHRLMSSMPRAKTTPFKTALTEHVHIVSDAKGRKVPAISILWKADAYNTITHNAYKNKSNDAEFCILFSTFIHHHIDSKNQKLVVNEGYGKNDTRVISKNIRHAPEIVEFFQEYEQHGKAEAKQMTITIFDNYRKQDSSGFLTLTFNGGVELSDMPEGMKNMQYLHVVNGLSPTTPSTGSSLVKSFPQTEFVFLEEDVDRYIQFIKDVAVYYRYLQEFNKEASSATAVLRSSFKQRLDALAKKDQAAEKAETVNSGNVAAKKSEKKKKTIEKRTDGDLPSTSSTSPSTQTIKVGEKKSKIGKKRQNESSTPSDESGNEKKRKLTSLANTLEVKKRNIVKTSTEGKTSQKGEKKNTGKSSVIKEVTMIDDESDERSEVEEDEEEENDGGCGEDEGDEEEDEEDNEGEEEDEEENDEEESSSEEEGGSEN